MTNPNDESRKRELLDPDIVKDVEIDPKAQAAFLREQAGDDEDLRKLVENLLEMEPGAASSEEEEADSSGVSGEKIGPFEIRRVMGGTASSLVFEAVKPPGPVVALKTMRFSLVGEPRKRFPLRVEALERLQHPNIAAVVESGMWREPNAGQELPYFAMEFVPDAKPWIDVIRKGDLGLRDALRLFLDVCDAVQAGHQVGCVHRDLKPNNVLVGRGGRVKITDFGVAAATDLDLMGLAPEARMGEEARTMVYMAPEQLDGIPENIDTRADVYSLGAMLYEIVARRPPYGALSLPPEDFAATIRRSPAPRPTTSPGHTDLAGIGSEIDAIVQRAMAADRDARYASVAELSGDVRRLLAQRAPTAVPEQSTNRASKPVRRPRVGIGILLVLLVAVALGGGVAVREALAAVEARDSAQQEAAQTARVNAFLGAVLASGAGTGARPATMLEAIDDVAARLGELAGEPETEIEIRLIVSNAYVAHGQPTKAFPHAARALELSRTVFGSASGPVADAHEHLARVAAAQGDPEEALASLREGLVVLRLSAGDQHGRFLRLHLSLGATLLALERRDEAQKEIEIAVTAARGLQDPVLLAEALTRWGEVQASAGDAKRAVRSYREAVGILDAAGSGETITAAQAHGALGKLLRGAGAVDAAVPHVRRAAAVFSGAGQVEEATATRLELARSLAQVFDYAGACAELIAVQPVLDARKKPDAERASARRLMSFCLRAQDRAEEAVPIARLAAADSAAVHGRCTPLSNAAMTELGRALRDAGQLGAAEAHLRAEVAARSGKAGKPGKTGKTEKASEKIACLEAENDLALVLALRREVQESLQLCQRVHASAAKLLPSGHVLWGTLHRAYGRCFLASENWARAEVELKMSLQASQSIFGPGHPQIRAVLRDLVALYEAMGRPDQKAKYKRRLESN